MTDADLRKEIIEEFRVQSMARLAGEWAERFSRKRLEDVINGEVGFVNNPISPTWVNKK